jgi:hypothetical protein
MIFMELRGCFLEGKGAKFTEFWGFLREKGKICGISGVELFSNKGKGTAKDLTQRRGGAGAQRKRGKGKGFMFVIAYLRYEACCFHA